MRVYEITVRGVDKLTYRITKTAVDESDLWSRLGAEARDGKILAEVRGQGGTWSPCYLTANNVACYELPVIVVSDG